MKLSDAIETVGKGMATEPDREFSITLGNITITPEMLISKDWSVSQKLDMKNPDDRKILDDTMAAIFMLQKEGER